MTTAQLARQLLGPGAAVQMTHHELAEPVFSGGPLRGIRFFARPQPLGKDLCWRDNFYVSLKAPPSRAAQASGADLPVTKEQVSKSFQIALAPRCRLKPAGYFAHAQEVSAQEAATALRRLAAIQQAAKSTRPLLVALRCTSELSTNPCGKNPRTVLASLPLHQIFVIDPLKNDGNSGWAFSVMPEGPGDKPFWEIVLEEGRSRRPELRMNWRIPAPF
jgi:hypothetical protein